MKVQSTYKILKAKAFDENIDESWIDWAIEMVEAGYESNNLYMLAGETKPFNQFELKELTNKILHDLQLDYSNKHDVLTNYVYYLITSSIALPGTYLKTLCELRDIYYQLDMDVTYQDFFLLYYAKSDLSMDEVQWYYDGANRGNIDQIISDRFRQWLNEFEQTQQRMIT